MHIIDQCPQCGHDFMRHTTDRHLAREVAWDPVTHEPASYQWICQYCDDLERRTAKDVNDIEGVVLCAMKGCPDESLPFSKYCQQHYDEIYQEVYKERDEHEKSYDQQ
jgi:hypothetical protein